MKNNAMDALKSILCQFIYHIKLNMVSYVNCLIRNKGLHRYILDILNNYILILLIC